MLTADCDFYRAANMHVILGKVYRISSEELKDVVLEVRTVSSLFTAYSSWAKPCSQSNASVLERLPSSTRRKDRCSVVSDPIQWLWAMCGWVFLEVVSSLVEACELQQQVVESKWTKTGENWKGSSGDMLANLQTNRHKDTLVTILDLQN